MFNKITQVITNSQLQLRPNANHGLWLMFLLPVCIISSLVKHPLEFSYLYKACSIFAFGYLTTSISFIFDCLNKTCVSYGSKWYLIPAAVNGALFHICLHKGFFFCVVNGLLATVGYHQLYLYILKTLPLSFTLGEAALVTQGSLLFLFSTSVNVYESMKHVPVKVSHISNLIIQLGLSGIALICCLVFLFPSIRKPTRFYITTVIVIFGYILIPLHIILKTSPILWILQYILEDISTIKIVLYWAFCSTLAIFAVAKQVLRAKKASTITRKIFHILAVVVFLPGLLYQCSFLYLSSGVILGIFLFLETIRILNMPPLGAYLQDGFVVFSDDKDTGIVALTPIYLLVGCSLPLWLHPAPCDITNSAGFNLLTLLSGVLSIGVGDTAASIVGTWIGRHHWSGSKKTLEGTIACIISQLLVVYGLVYFEFMKINQEMMMKVGTAVVVGSLIEAKTSQIDNLVIPLVMFIIMN